MPVSIIDALSRRVEASFGSSASVGVTSASLTSASVVEPSAIGIASGFERVPSDGGVLSDAEEASGAVRFPSSDVVESVAGSGSDVTSVEPSGIRGLSMELGPTVPHAQSIRGADVALQATRQRLKLRGVFPLITGPSQMPRNRQEGSARGTPLVEGVTWD